jgi:maleate isomerase
MSPGYAFLNARLISDKPTIEARLGDYFAHIPETADEFANAPIGAYTFACTGASYLAGRAREEDTAKRFEDTRGRPFITTRRAAVDALHLLGATRIGLVSPYPPSLTEASIMASTSALSATPSITESDFHPIYSLAADAASTALDQTAAEKVDATVMLGTGMPTLGPFLAHAAHADRPVLSCMSALAWRALAVFDPALRELAAARRYLAGEGWRERYHAFVKTP